MDKLWVQRSNVKRLFGVVRVVLPFKDNMRNFINVNHIAFMKFLDAIRSYDDAHDFGCFVTLVHGGSLTDSIVALSFLYQLYLKSKIERK